MAKKNVPAVKKGGGVPAVINMRQRAGKGMEEVDVASMSTPFLKVLQKGTPEVDEASEKKLKGAKEGMFFETASQRMHDGKKGIELIQCYFRRVFIHWGPKFGQFKGSFDAAAAEKMRADETVMAVDNKLFFPLNGKVDPKKSDRLVDTREHYMILRGDDYVQRLIFPLNSTQIKKSKDLMTFLKEAREIEDGEKYNPASYSYSFTATTGPESNDEGSWFGVNFKSNGLMNLRDRGDYDLFMLAEAFAESVHGGKITANYAAAATDEEEEPRRRGF